MRLLLGITGGIAAYKSPLLIRLFQKSNVDVRVVATANAFQFVTRVTLESLSGHPVCHDTFAEHQDSFEHIELARWADAMVVAPATANSIAKFATGVCDDLLSTVYLTLKCPVLIAPAMNTDMYADRVTQRNLKSLRESGVVICEPASGWLACGQTGAGRMAEPEEIFDLSMLMLGECAALEGRKVLVTAGATRERIDPVRFISNRSTGKMGYAVAEAFARHGATVTLVTGPSSMLSPARCSVIGVESAEQMHDAVMRIAGDQDIIVKAAAVADFTPESVADQKIKKSGDGMTLTLKRTKDILQALAGVKKDNQVLVGFAAETQNHLANAADKLKRKKLDMIVLNDVGSSDAGFAVDTNRVMFIKPATCSEQGWELKEIDGTNLGIKATPLLSKHAVADMLVKNVIEILNGKS